MVELQQVGNVGDGEIRLDVLNKIHVQNVVLVIFAFPILYSSLMLVRRKV